MLTGEQIRIEVKKGSIIIEPFDPRQVNPNSYDVRLFELIYRVIDRELDLKKPYEVEEILIPPEGYVLEPTECYLGSTVEYTSLPNHVPMYEGRSTTGRYFMSSHETAGFGDIGFEGNWTLEITVKKPLRVYPRMRIGQVAFGMPDGPIVDRYHGNYQGQRNAKVGVPGNL